jgi:aspartate kinase
MPTIPVLKFGGTTLQGDLTLDKGRHQTLLEACRVLDNVEAMYQEAARCRMQIRAQRLLDVAADFIIPQCREGRVPVVVTSAFGWATNKWKEFTDYISQSPDAREYARLQMAGELRSNAALALALREKGYAAKSLTGREAGIRTTPQYVDAIIEDVDPTYIRTLVSNGVIPVVAGFQGHFPDERTGRNEVSILGRGGSNQTAVALAHALDQRECCMYSDVDGVYDKDPRVHADARKQDTIYAEDLLNIEPFPQVIQRQAVLCAMDYGIDIWIKDGSQPGLPGTLIVCRPKDCIFA